jgi:hypothetical protein
MENVLEEARARVQRNCVLVENPNGFDASVRQPIHARRHGLQKGPS